MRQLAILAHLTLINVLKLSPVLFNYVDITIDEWCQSVERAETNNDSILLLCSAFLFTCSMFLKLNFAGISAYPWHYQELAIFSLVFDRSILALSAACIIWVCLTGYRG